ncbi:hypothetical protein [Xanthomonas sp. NCPPB 2632]|uniref:hypothetical protein n=1 Tax=Xanthomonas sp. NCPPB 2632 TaxID=3240912 RepID=UPI0035187B9A
MNCCPDCSAQCRLIDALPCVETAPENTRARLMERREAVLAGSLNEPVPGRLNRDGREAVLRERWQYPRSVAHVDAGRGMVGFQRVYAPDALVGVLGMVIRSATGVTGQIQERRWVGLSVDPGAFDGVARALVERNVLLRIVP